MNNIKTFSDLYCFNDEGEPSIFRGSKNRLMVTFTQKTNNFYPENTTRIKMIFEFTELNHLENKFKTKAVNEIKKKKYSNNEKYLFYCEKRQYTKNSMRFTDNGAFQRITTHVFTPEEFLLDKKQFLSEVFKFPFEHRDIKSYFNFIDSKRLSNQIKVTHNKEKIRL